MATTKKKKAPVVTLSNYAKAKKTVDTLEIGESETVPVTTAQGTFRAYISRLGAMSQKQFTTRAVEKDQIMVIRIS